KCRFVVISVASGANTEIGVMAPPRKTSQRTASRRNERKIPAGIPVRQFGGSITVEMLAQSPVANAHWARKITDTLLGHIPRIQRKNFLDSTLLRSVSTDRHRAKIRQLKIISPIR